MKYKTGVEFTKDVGLFAKLSKYSTVRLLRKTTGRTGNASLGSSQTLSASYYMTGRESDDHKMEIGAPILISKTTIDADATHNVCDRSSGRELNETKEASCVPADDPTPSMIIDDIHSKKFKCSRSKSASNLHKAELNLYLIRTSSTHSNVAYNDKIRSVSNHNVDKMTTPSATNYYYKHTISERDANEGYRRSQESVALNGCTFEDDDEFHLRSASFQSLKARKMCPSIEELNDTTEQINGSDAFEADDDYEYCAHRDTIPPTERRVILLHKKSSSKLFGARKDKLSNAWSGFKSWIDEERGKIKEVVNKHAAAQRVNANKSADVTTPIPTDETTGNITHIRLNIGENFITNADRSNACKPEHGNRCIIEGGTDVYENQMHSLTSTASLNAKGKNIEDHSVEVKFTANELFCLISEYRYIQSQKCRMLCFVGDENGVVHIKLTQNNCVHGWFIVCSLYGAFCVQISE